VAEVKHPPFPEKKILVLGDPILGLIGVAAGADALIYRDNCSETVEELKKNLHNYSVIIYFREMESRCKNLSILLNEFRQHGLVIALDNPREVEKIDVIEYYRSIVKKYLGVSIEL